MLKNKVEELVDKYLDEVISIRRYLHQNPELSLKEFNTAEFIVKELNKIGLDAQRGRENNGVVSNLNLGKGKKTLMLRADMDALPIQEETNFEFKSKNPGVMHACGHDAHTAYMLILGETLIEMKDQLRGNVVIIHQPAEEMPPGGAKGMIDDGVLEGVDHVLGAHVMSMMETGKIYYREGFVQTGRAYFRLVVKGQGGHGSSPHTSNDAIVAGAHFVTTAQTIVSRRLNPFETGVVTIGSFDGKGQFNVIKDTVTIEGDVRALTDDTRDNIQNEMTRLVRGLEEMFGVICDFEFKKDYPALYNDPEFTSYVATTLKNAKLDDIKAIDICEPQPPSEDFAFYALERPSTFIYSGAAPEDGPMYPHHHPKFNINETSMLVVAEAVGTIVLDYLK